MSSQSRHSAVRSQYRPPNPKKLARSDQPIRKDFDSPFRSSLGCVETDIHQSTIGAVIFLATDYEFTAQSTDSPGIRPFVLHTTRAPSAC
jgi:hypothetical protein